jgi:hypothetical protein
VDVLTAGRYSPLPPAGSYLSTPVLTLQWGWLSQADPSCLLVGHDAKRGGTLAVVVVTQSLIGYVM